jgi:putative ABC transport system permease protein
VRDWQAFVRARLKLPDLTAEREARIVRELAAQLEDCCREALAGGATDADADAIAARQIGDWDQMARDVYAAERSNMRNMRSRIDRLADTLDSRVHTPTGRLKVIADMLRDSRYAVRQLMGTPGFTFVAILTLALGIGATTAIFSVVNGVLLRPLPFPDPDRLVRVHEIVPQYGRFSVAPATFLDWRQQSTVFEHLAAYTGSSVTFSGSEGPERIPAAMVSAELFDLLKVQPALGRNFAKEEDAPGKNSVVVLSHGLWQRRFNADPGVLGSSVTLSGRPVTIIGVMPAGFYFPARTTELWMPVAINPANASRGGHFMGVVARTKADVTVEQASIEIKAISERLAREYPANSANESAEIVPLLDQIVGPIRPALLTLLAAVGVVVLIACANVANLLLVRASVREKEIAIRTAIGAGRLRLVLQMLAESLVLALAGGILGLLLAYLAIPLIQTLSAGGIPRVADVAIEGRVLAFVAGVSVLTGLIFGLAPAWQASRATIGGILKEGGRGSSSSSGRWVRNGLLVGEVALSIVLLVGAALLLRSFSRLTSVDPGFDADRILAFQVALPPTAYPDPHNRVSFFDALLQKLESLPQVSAAGMVQTLPIRSDYVLSFAIQGRPPAKPGESPSANHRSISPGYFQTLGIPLLRGRTFTERDTEKMPMVAIVDQTFADRHFAGEDPIGNGIDIGNGTDGFYEIVGIVGNVHHAGLDTAPTPTMYIPFRQEVFSSMSIVVRTDGDPAQLSNAARQAVREIDSSLPAFQMAPLTDILSESVAQRRFSMLLLALFALIALFLASVGLYGVVAYTVSRRTQEIGLRMAIGAQAGEVMRMVLSGGMKLALVGVLIGTAAALALSRLVASMLYDVTAFDPLSYIATGLILLAVAALACYVPARRAMRIDPIVALRQE